MIKLLFYVVFLIIFSYFVLTRYNKNNEHYINVMEAQEVYNNYRSYIDSNYKKDINRFLRRRPPMVSSNCVLDKMSKCKKRAFELCSVPLIN